jgi:hypothetical protein
MTKESGYTVKYIRYYVKKKEKAKPQQRNASPYIYNPFFLPRDYPITINPNPKT